ncbi:hypothetical protein SAMN02746089_00095 [Caldanaerobius fijiensis DSM 17918]|uniref:Uncharacterized protein n=1 Tax=Caldanaerobius fijiensis DSM 17918 TaxID=1121256 RepID=A0A1M4SPX2_9THEO|nr:hypothetical protein [Caldanaerobius fijiensis]SHE34248.1 hypothetical protein SAMN02746089_00095 [Caldanaerobius fijiensis DSM 17918]
MLCASDEKEEDVKRDILLLIVYLLVFWFSMGFAGPSEQPLFPIIVP